MYLPNYSLTTTTPVLRLLLTSSITRLQQDFSYIYIYLLTNDQHTDYSQTTPIIWLLPYCTFHIATLIIPRLFPFFSTPSWQVYFLRLPLHYDFLCESVRCWLDADEHIVYSQTPSRTLPSKYYSEKTPRQTGGPTDHYQAKITRRLLTGPPPPTGRCRWIHRPLPS